MVNRRFYRSEGTIGIKESLLVRTDRDVHPRILNAAHQKLRFRSNIQMEAILNSVRNSLRR